MISSFGVCFGSVFGVLSAIIIAGFFLFVTLAFLGSCYSEEDGDKIISMLDDLFDD